MSAWDRQAGEPPKAYKAFCIYRDMGPQERTLEKTGKTLGISAPYTQELSAKWAWINRCDQWDAHVQTTIDRAFLEKTAENARERAAAFSGLLEKAKKALEKVDIEKVYLRDVAMAMKVAAEGLRLEDGLETKRVAMEITDVRTVIAKLPAEVRAPLLRALAANVGAERNQTDTGGIPLGLGDFDE